MTATIGPRVLVASVTNDPACSATLICGPITISDADEGVGRSVATGLDAGVGAGLAVSVGVREPISSTEAPTATTTTMATKPASAGRLARIGDRSKSPTRYRRHIGEEGVEGSRRLRVGRARKRLAQASFERIVGHRVVSPVSSGSIEVRIARRP